MFYGFSQYLSQILIRKLKIQTCLKLTASKIKQKVYWIQKMFVFKTQN